MGSSRVPGPTTYWIDAIAQVPESLHRDLHVGDLEAAQIPEGFHEALRDYLPTGSYQTSIELQELFQYRNGEVTVLLSDDASTVVIAIVYD